MNDYCTSVAKVEHLHDTWGVILFSITSTICSVVGRIKDREPKWNIVVVHGSALSESTVDQKRLQKIVAGAATTSVIGVFTHVQRCE